MTELNNPQHNFQKIERVRAGQKLIIVAIMLIVPAYVLAFLSGRLPILGLGVLVLVLTSWTLSIAGIIKLSRGLGYNIVMCVLFGILILLPLIGLITLAILNDKATKALRTNGYKVGLLGASPKA